MAEIDYVAEMALPAGSTCDECKSARRCFGLGFSGPGRRSCDFYPSRFRPTPRRDPEAGGIDGE